MHSIRKINLTNSAANRGLFSNVSGKICNLKILDAAVGCYTAPVVGMALSGTLENIYVKGTITADGMGPGNNLNNFGCGLLAGRYVEGAAVTNVIVEVGSMKEGLRLATALGKFGDNQVNADIFQNCYTVGADGAVYMNYRQAPATTAQKLNFSAASGNRNFDTIYELWEHSKARYLAEEVFRLEAPLPGVSLAGSYDMNNGVDFTVTDEKLIGTVKYVTVKGTEHSLAGAVIQGNTLTVPAASFQLDSMPSGALTLVVETDQTKVEIHGEFIWIIHDLAGLKGMKNHLIADGTFYTGSLALGSDITEELTITYGECIFSDKETFAGTFDGRFHSIHQLKLHTNAGNRGLFSNVSGKVCNLKILNAKVNSYHAPVVGMALSGTLENIYVKGKVTGDGMSASTNFNNFGCSLLAGRYKEGASVKNVIVEAIGLPKTLRMATAMGKFADDQVTEAIFENCYTVNAEARVFMDFQPAPSTTAYKHDFTPGTDNRNFATMYDLWCDEKAVVLARDVFQLAQPETPKPVGPADTPDPTVTVTFGGSYEMNGASGTEFILEDALLTGGLQKVMVADTYVELPNVTLEQGRLTIPAESFLQEDMPSGTLTLLLQTDSEIIGVTGEFIWLLNSADELLAMKNHMKPGSDGITYTGHLALAADIDLTGKLMRYTGMTGTTFTGIFDGRLHTLTGLGANNTNLGLFANVGGTVKNLLLTDCYISDSAATVAGGILTGTLENIYVRGRLLRDGIGMYTDVEQYGAGLLAGRIEETAAVRNVIVEVESTGSSLKMATAFGKLMRGTTEAVFENCYTVAADGAGYLVYNSGWLKKDFASDSFETMVMLWKDTEAAALAAALGLERPAEHIVTEQSYDLNSTDAQTLTVSGIPVSAADKVTLLGVDGTEVEVTATVANGTLSITGEAMTAVQGRLATGQQKMMIYAGEEAYCVSGLELVWVIHTAEELMDMKSHLTVQADGKTVVGAVALGADIDLAGVNIRTNPMKDTYFKGVFDGRYYTVSNINVIKSASRVGILGNVYGTVRNLKVVGAAVAADSAAVVGGTLYGAVENVYVQGVITGDNMQPTTNMNNFGCGLLAGKIEHDAKIKNCIVELSEIKEDLRLATAYGKQHKLAATEGSVFFNCYAINADGCTFMTFSPKQKVSFAPDTANKNFASMWQLWQDSEAKALAQKLGISEPEKPGIAIEMADAYDMNSTDAADLVIEDTRLDGNLVSITVKGTGITLSGGVLESGRLTIPAESFQFDNMPSGNLILRVVTDQEDYDISGSFVWLVHTKAELLAMKSHLTTGDNVIYDGMIALGADITEDIILNSANAIFTTAETFAGTFDGRMHELASITANTANIGLFTNVSGTICNVKVMDALVQKNTAALVGRIFTGTMENVYVKGSVTGDGMAAASNLNNFGCGLPVARYQYGAAMNNVIVEATEIADGLRLATAFGKLGDYKTKDVIFTNCFAVGAGDAAYMNYVSGQTTADKLAFAEGTTNGNYESYTALWEDTEGYARNLAENVLKLAEPAKETVQITLEDSFDMNVSDGNFVLTDTRFTGVLSSVAVQGTQITLSGAVLADGVLTIPAESFQLEDMPSGMLTLTAETDTATYKITGDFIWVINSASELLKMKNHMTTADETIYNGMLALGADIDLSNVTIKNNGLSGKTYAGTFDGRMHTLSNMNANAGNVGLFGYVSGTVRNLKITNATVSSYTAAVVGGTLSGTLENIYVQGSITKDGMAATSNLANFGCGLLAARIQAGAKINNCIVELTSVADELRLATAMGKLHQSTAKESNVFTNCYAVNADGCTFMKHGTWEKVSFTEGGSNKNFADMAALLADPHAALLAKELGLLGSETEELNIAMAAPYDMDAKGEDFVIENSKLTGMLLSVTVQGTDIVLSDAALTNGMLTIPAKSFRLDHMPSGRLTLMVVSDKMTCRITGNFVWIIDNASELLKMKNHMTTGDETIYDGMLALSADMDLQKVTIKNNGLSGKTFAGSFDGRMHTLSNMNANTGNIGLFGYVSGTVRNLKITNATVSSYTAAVVGGTLTGTLENIYVQGSITKDGMAATSKLANFGCGLLAARIQAGAKINNCIVELSFMADGLRLATAFGKLHQSAAVTEKSVFTNCYAIGADDCTFMKYGTWTKQSFTAGSSNQNFASMAALLADETAAKLAEKMELTS